MEEKYNLIGVDGNAFAIIGYVQNALKVEGFEHLCREYWDKATASDYSNLLSTSIEYLDIANGLIDVNN